MFASSMRMHVKWVGRCFRRQLVTITSTRRRAVQTASRFVPNILISLSDEPCFGMVISVRVSPSMRFLTAPFAPMIAPKNALNTTKNCNFKHRNKRKSKKTTKLTVEHETLFYIDSVQFQSLRILPGNPRCHHHRFQHTNLWINSNRLKCILSLNLRLNSPFSMYSFVDAGFWSCCSFMSILLFIR